MKLIAVVRKWRVRRLKTSLCDKYVESVRLERQAKELDRTSTFIRVLLSQIDGSVCSTDFFQSTEAFLLNWYRITEERADSIERRQSVTEDRIKALEARIRSMM